MFTPVSSTCMLSTMIEREVMWLRKYIDNFRGRKFVIFAAGLYGKRFYQWLFNDYGIEAEFFIDNNPNFVGKTACNKPITLKPWEYIEHFSKDYFVLISASAVNYRQIAEQLNNVGVPYLSSDSFQIVYFWERCKRVVESLYDDFSKMSYLGAVWYWLTYDTKFLQRCDNQYFAVDCFMCAIDDIVCDVGGFVGDTTEEYIKRGLGTCKVIVFEPDERCHVPLSNRISRLKNEWGLSEDTIEIVSYGVHKESGHALFSEVKKGHIVNTDNGKISLKVYALDDYFKDKKAPTLIKADIEGAETNMLKGAEGIIEHHKPKLAISIYHSPEDFISIPEYIDVHMNKCNYNLEVRNHPGPSSETVLYCWI